MAVANIVALADELYVPFRGTDRQAGFVGSLQASAAVTGDATGGVADVSFTAQMDMFGFRPIIIPTRIVGFDDQAAATSIRLLYLPAGNERLKDTINEQGLALTQSAVNTFNFTELSIPIDPDQEAATSVLQAVWAANVNLKVYTLRLFAIVYDREELAKGKHKGKTWDTLLGGVR